MPSAAFQPPSFNFDTLNTITSQNAITSRELPDLSDIIFSNPEAYFSLNADDISLPDLLECLLNANVEHDNFDDRHNQDEPTSTSHPNLETNIFSSQPSSNINTNTIHQPTLVFPFPTPPQSTASLCYSSIMAKLHQDHSALLKPTPSSPAALSKDSTHASNSTINVNSVNLANNIYDISAQPSPNQDNNLSQNSMNCNNHSSDVLQPTQIRNHSSTANSHRGHDFNAALKQKKARQRKMLAKFKNHLTPTDDNQ